MPLLYGARAGRRHRRLQARPRPVRRGRPAPPRGARRPRGHRARQRAAVRGAAARGRDREGAARVRPGALLAGGPRRRLRAGRRRLGPAPRRPTMRRSGCSAITTATSSAAQPASTDAERRANRRLAAAARPRPAVHDARGAVRDRAGGVRRVRRALSPRRGDAHLRRRAVRRRRPLGRDRRRCAAPGVTFGARELELLGGVAHQAKLAISTAEGYASLERTFLATVEALANALEAKDEYTSSHARWITDMALRVGRRARRSTSRR